MPDEIETIDKNPKSWAAWKREAERLQAIIDDMALAAMDSEPVAYTEKHEISNMHATGLYLRAWPADRARNAVEGYTIPLYRHAQKPVIPDGYVMVPKEPTQAMCAAFNDSDYGRKSLRERYVAMLAAAQQPQDEPQNIPEIIPGWIPVSERMPEDCTQVILWDAEIGEVTSGHYSHKTHTFYHCGDAIQNEITHWMLPPCAPQEEK